MVLVACSRPGDGFHRATLEFRVVAVFAEAAVDAFGGVDHRLVVHHLDRAGGAIDGAEAAADALFSVHPVSSLVGSA